MRSPEALINSNPVDLYSPSLLTMILLTTLIATLFLTQIARAVPQACRYPISPEGQFHFEDPVEYYTAVYNPVYDNSSQTLDDVACSELASIYPEFGDVPLFPNIGGAPNTTYNSTNCGAIWKITNFEDNDLSIYFISIDDASDFDLSLEAFKAVGGDTATGSLKIEAEIVGHITI